ERFLAHLEATGTRRSIPSIDRRTTRRRGFRFATRDGSPLRCNTLRYNFVRLCARARIHQEHSYSPTPGMHDLRHTFAVPCLECWLREGKDLRQKLPVLSGYMGHAILKSTELYLRLVPGRFVKSLSSLQAPPKPRTHVRRTTTTPEYDQYDLRR